jgi:hypothetical protein
MDQIDFNIVEKAFAHLSIKTKDLKRHSSGYPDRSSKERKALSIELSNIQLILNSDGTWTWNSKEI